MTDILEWDRLSSFSVFLLWLKLDETLLNRAQQRTSVRWLKPRSCTGPYPIEMEKLKLAVLLFIGSCLLLVFLIALSPRGPNSGMDVPHLNLVNGEGSAAYVKTQDKGATSDPAFDFTAPQNEGSRIARFVYQISKTNPRLDVLNLTIRYNWTGNKDEKEGFAKNALIDDVTWVRGFESADAFSNQYGKYFANILFQELVEENNRTMPDILQSVATGDIDPSAFGQTKEEFVNRVVNAIPDIMRKTGLNPAQQPPLNRTAFTDSWRPVGQSQANNVAREEVRTGSTPIPTGTMPVRYELPSVLGSF